MIWAICNGLPRVTVNFFKKNTCVIFLKETSVTRGDPLQIAQNHENLRENLW